MAEIEKLSNPNPLSLSLSLSLFNWVDLDLSHHSLPPCPNWCLKVVSWCVGWKFPTLTSKVASSLAWIWGEYNGFCLWVVLGIMVGIEVRVVVVNYTSRFGLCLNCNCSKNFRFYLCLWQRFWQLFVVVGVRLCLFWLQTNFRNAFS